MSKDEAIAEAVRLRFRPIVMTAASTAIGLTPLVFQLAVGMERMSPLAIVAAFGLLVGIFTSCWIYPVIYSLFDSLTEKLKGIQEVGVKCFPNFWHNCLLQGIISCNV